MPKWDGSMCVSLWKCAGATSNHNDFQPSAVRRSAFKSAVAALRFFCSHGLPRHSPPLPIVATKPKPQDSPVG